MIRVCVADDEIMVRRSLRHKLARVPVELEYLGDAGSGREALELYRSQQPDIFLVDIRMPEMDGLELIRTIQDFYPGCRTSFIIISGYDDFAYMQQAIRIGVEDYLKKPIIQEELNHAIARSVERLMNGRRNASFSDNQAIIPFEDFSRSVDLTSSLDEPAILFVIRNGDKDILRKVCQDFNCGRFQMVSFRWAEEVILIYFDSPVDPENAAFLANALLPFCDNLVYGSVHNKTLLHALEQADAVMNVRFVKNSRTALDFNKYESSQAEQTNLDMLRLSLERGEISNCRKIVNQIFKNLAADSQNILGLGRVYKDIILLLLTQFVTAQQHAPLMLETELLFFSTSRFSTLEDIFATICSYCEDCIHVIMKKSRNKELVDMVCEYIEKHYMDKISLQSIADYFFISPNYLCKKFKEKKQNTINNYLEEIRMEKACSLLTSTSLSISDVSRLTGYNDTNYFSRVFKNCYSVTPSQYRKIMKQ